MTLRRLLWIMPAVILVSGVLIYPAIRALLLSFTHYGLATAFETHFAGIDNFRRIFADSRLHSSFATTAIFVVISVTLELGFGLALALAGMRLVRGQNIARTLLLIPWTLPTAIAGVLWAWILSDQLGILNHVLASIGLLDRPVSWLAQPVSALGSVIVVDVWKTVPFVFLILLAGLQSIPSELYEAMAVDGGSAWAAFRYVTWPHLRTFVFIALIFRIIQASAIFDLVYVLTGGGPGGETETVSIYAYQTTMRYLDFSYGATITIALVLVLAIVAIVLRRILREAE
jgi:multiple sugar transport system permease protein